MPQWPQDNQAARNAFYGDPGAGQIEAQMVPVVPPFAMFYADEKGRVSPVKKIMFHRKAAPYLLAALQEIWDYCGHDQAKIDASGASKYFGAYAHRMVRGSTTKWSNHAYAAAIDLNAGQNALGKIGNMPQFIVDAFCRQGAMWGGWYKNRPDWMHFEFVDNGGRKPQSMPPIFGAAPVEAVPVAATVTAKPIDATDRRTRMGRVILSFEARRDSQGRLAVYKLPSNDGGGSYEVAGINDRYHPEQASHLRSLIQAGQFAEAEASAVEYMVKYTDAAAGWTTNAGVEFYLRDCVFNRGPGGAAKILQIALGVGVDGSIGRETRDALSKAVPGELLDKLRAAREHYEDQVAPGRPNLRRGLINRWDNALAAAKKFAAETPAATGGGADLAKIAVAASGGVAVTHGVKQGWGLFEWSLLAGGVVLLATLAYVAWRYVWPWWKARNAARKPLAVPTPAVPAAAPAVPLPPARARKEPAAKPAASKRRAPRKGTAKRPAKKRSAHRRAA
jgi:lysozyme family protein